MLEKDPDKRPPDCLVLARKIDSIRRKLDRKKNITSLGEDEATVAENKMDKIPLENRPGPATLMSRLVRLELEGQNQGGPLGRMFNSVFVLVPLLILCVGTIVYAFWPLSAEALFRHGQSIMESSTSVHDWEHAWDDYFEPLNQRFPDHPYKEEVEEYRRKIADKRSVFMSEPQRLYLQGEARLKEGDLAGAQKIWQNLDVVFADADVSERAWVVKARKGLEKIEEDGKRQERWQTVKRTLRKAARLADEGNMKGAEKIWEAVEALYRDDPFAQEILKEVKRERAAHMKWILSFPFLAL